MMKKIGYVMAYSERGVNFGTSLQGYALLKKMQELGHDVEIINYVKCLSFFQKVQYVINAIRCGELKTLVGRRNKDKSIKLSNFFGEAMFNRRKAANEYKKDKLLPWFHDYVGYDALHNGSKNYDSVIVGSDQVWSPLSFANKFFNLLFVDDAVRKISYASSFGVSVIPRFQRKATGNYLDRFYMIGVREQKGKEIVDSLSKNTAQVVADPTLLLTKEEWMKEIDESSIAIQSKYIFCYFLGTNQESRTAAKLLSERTGLKIINILNMDQYVATDEKFGDWCPSYVGPNDFLKLIYNAEYVCTDSFHCTVFSTIFHRKFMTFYRFSCTSKTSRNSRIDSLFNVLGIPNEHLFSGDIMNIDMPIDYEKIEENLKLLRSESIKFLRDSLS